MTPDFLLLGITATFSAGTGWGVSYASTRRVSKEFDKHVIDDNQLHIQIIDRLARIETKLDAVTKK